MAVLPKKRFEWMEPGEFRRVSNIIAESQIQWWYRPLIALGCGGAMLGFWGLAKLDPKKHPPPFGTALVVAIGGALVVFYTLAWLARVLPHAVMVFDNVLARIIGNTRREWQYSYIEEYGLRHYGDFNLLVVDLRNGNQELFGIPLTVDLGALELFFSSCGLTRMSADRERQSPTPSEGVYQFESVLNRKRSS